MFEITGAGIKPLSDADLRTLIGLLCEADNMARAEVIAKVDNGRQVETEESKAQSGRFE
jgi:hypothetical protein